MTTSTTSTTSAYTDLASLHSHYQSLLATERSLWDAERALYLQRIAALEAHVSAAGLEALPPAPPPNTTNTTTSGASTNGHGESAVEDEEDDEEEEITQKEMGLLLMEAKRVVGASNGPKGRTPVGDLGGMMGVGYQDEPRIGRGRDKPKVKEEVVELKLRKTSNFGVEFGRAWR